MLAETLLKHHQSEFRLVRGLMSLFLVAEIAVEHSPGDGEGYSLVMTERKTWRPLFKPAGYDTLREQFDPPLFDAIILWLEQDLHASNVDIWFSYQLESRADLGLRVGIHYSFDRDVVTKLRGLSPHEFANVLDYFLFYMEDYQYEDAGGKLDFLLQVAGSKWQLGFGGHQGLVERIPEGVQQVVEQTLAGGSTASTKLREAWVSAFGVNPDASNAYRLGVIAVEIAALTVMPDAGAEATLGTVITRLETQKGWELPFRTSERAPGADTLARMLRLLWRGHADRHGSPDYKAVSHQEAQAAVLLAATLVGWLSSGVLARVEQ